MSLDIYLRDTEGNEVAWINWLRNPYGLEQWVRDNTGIDFWHEVNDHAYDDSKNVDRSAFLAKIQQAAEAVEKLERGFFRIRWQTREKTAEMQQRLGLPIGRDFEIPADVEIHKLEGECAWVDMDEFVRHAHVSFGIRNGERALDHYKAWMRELLDFAERLQDPTLEFYCSN